MFEQAPWSDLGFNPKLLCERSATESLNGHSIFNHESENNIAVINGIFLTEKNIESEKSP